MAERTYLVTGGAGYVGSHLVLALVGRGARGGGLDGARAWDAGGMAEIAYRVTGGAGYVGSHLVLALVERGDRVVVLDDLRQGHRGALPPGVELVRADIADRHALDEVFAAWR